MVVGSREGGFFRGCHAFAALQRFAAPIARAGRESMFDPAGRIRAKHAFAAQKSGMVRYVGEGRESMAPKATDFAALL